MNSSHERLATALRGVAAASSQGASAELGAKLQAEFHGYHARRRKIRRIQIGSAALCLSAIIVLLLGMHPRHPAESRAHTQPPKSPVAVETAAAAASKPAVPRLMRAKTRKKVQRTDDFMVLPSYDPAPVGDDLRIVRVELTGESLRRLGAPVTEELSDQRMKADVVVGTDGTPYAVRLVNGH